MKSERRHELKENVLAKDLGKAEQFVREKWKALLLGVLVVVVLILGVTNFIHSRRQARQGELQRYAAAMRDVEAIFAQGRQLSQRADMMAQWLPPAEAAEQIEAMQKLYADDLAKLADVRRDLRALAEETSQDDLAALCYAQVGQVAYAEMMLRHDRADEAALRALADEAQRAYGKVLSDYAAHKAAAGMAHFGQGLLAEMRGDFAAAKQAFERAVALGHAGLRLDEATGKIKLIADVSKPIEFPASAPVVEAPTQPAAEPAEDVTTAPAEMETPAEMP